MDALRNLFGLTRTPSAREIAQREYDEAQRTLLAALTGRDYADAMVSYHMARLRRLEAALGVQQTVLATEVAR